MLTRGQDFTLLQGAALDEGDEMGKPGQGL